MKIEKGKIQAIASSTKAHHDNTIETTLDHGDYIIVSKVNWKFWEEHSYNLASYGPQKIKFSQPILTDVNLVNDFIANKSELGFGDMEQYPNTQITKRRYFSIEEGYGFICITNHENFILETTIRLEKLKGIWVLPPFNLPLQLTVFPFENVICKFLVDPEGYHYHIK